MNLRDHELKIGEQSEEVRLLHRELALLGFSIPDDERARATFGEGTHRAVMELQKKLGLPTTGIVDKNTVASINNELEPRPSPLAAFVVRGHVVFANGTPLDQCIVRAFDRDLRSEQLLGEAVSSSAGRYEIGYSDEQFQRDEKASADLVVRAFDRDGRELAASPILFNAGREETVDLIVGNEVYRGPSEYERLEMELRPLLQGLSFAELTEDARHQDVSFLAGETGQSLTNITFLILAHRLHKETQLPAEAFYGMFRQGLPTQLPALLAQSADVQRSALVRSAGANIIPPSFGANADRIVSQFRALIVRQAMHQPSGGGNGAATFNDLLGVSLADSGLRETFLSLYAEHTGPVEEFWRKLAERPEFEGRIESTQRTLQFGVLTGNHLPLVRELHRMQGNRELSSLADLARFDEQGWLEILAQNREEGPIGAPPGVPGRDEAERVRNYAKAMSHLVEDAFPSRFIAHRLETDELPGREDLRRFLKSNTDFDIRSTRLTRYLRENPDALTGVQDPEQTKVHLQGLQRIYKLAPRYEQASALIKRGIDSAHAITRMGQNVFLAKCGDAVGGKAQAGKIYAKAQQVQSMALHLAVEYGLTGNKAPTQATPDEAVLEVEGVPEWSSLFGSLELCGCEHCRSVYSPAAYLVDVLHFLQDRPSKVVAKSAKDVLFLRRPDLGEIELTCENTHTPLPYVDLVNEALENAVAPPTAFSPFNLPAAVEADVDHGILSPALLNAFAAANHPLSDEALLTVGGKGRPWDVTPGWWTIDEPAFTYTLRKEGNQLRVVSRSLQTKGSAAERAANPQYVNANAYSTLSQAVYPWSLPFDLWAEEARTYLDHLGVSRFRIMERFRSGERAAILNGAALAREHLGLTNAQADLITGATTSQPGAANPAPWNLWGFETQSLSAQHSIPDPSDSTRRITAGFWLSVLSGRVDVFLQQSGLTYKELLGLLDTYFVNPVAGDTRTIRIVSTDSGSPDTCETNKLSLVGLGQTAAARTLRFTRLWRALGWSPRDLDRAITALAPAELDDDFLTRLSHVQRLHTALKVPVQRLLSWWAELDTAFYVDPNAPGQPRAASLYEQLFRNRATLNPPDPAFTENPADLEGTLSGHAAAITAALGISAQDFALLLDDAHVIPRDASNPAQPDDVLNLAHLSRLHRHTSLARALRLSVRDYLAALELISTDPFATTTDTLLFVETVDEARAAGLSFTELAYLLRHVLTPESTIVPGEESIATHLDELRAGLQKITAENTFRADPTDPAGPTIDLNGDLTRQKLALLNWEQALIEQAVATLNGAVVYEAPLAALPAGLKLPNATGVYTVSLAALPTNAIPSELSGVVIHDAADGELMATRLLGPSERTLLKTAAEATGDSAFLNAIAALVQQQDELQGEIHYEASRQVLVFTGPMTNVRKARLDAASSDAGYRAAVQALYDAPRRFISRGMRTFSVTDFATGLTALPADVKIPKALKRKVYFDASAPGRLHCLGVMSEQERDALLALSTDPADPHHAAYQTAIGDLYAQAESLVPAASDAFLTATGPDNDAGTLFDMPVKPPGERFRLVLERLLPYLRHTLSEHLAVQKMAEATQLETRSAEALLHTWLASPVDLESDPALKRRCLAELLEPTFAESNTNVQLAAATFPAQFKTFLRVHKAALVASRLKLTYRQLGWLFSHGPEAGWLDLNALPTDAQESAAPFDGWLRLLELARLRDGLPQGEKALNELLALAHSIAEAATASVRNEAKQEWFALATHWTRWTLPDLEVLLGPANDHTQSGLLGATFPSSYLGARLLIHLRELFGLLKRLGMPAQQAADLAEGNVTQAEARGVRQAMRARYDEAQWLHLAKPLRDVLREKQRAALVAHLVAHLELPFTQLETPHPVLALNANRPAVRELQQKLNAVGATPPLAVDGMFGMATRTAVMSFQSAHSLTADGIVGNATWAVLDVVRRSLRDANELYAHFLLDVEMAPCMMTSRIKQAISSVQLFVQRCLMNLEADVAASAEVDVKWREWKWMKNYRVWEANRKIFLYPENWIEPELRDDKSPFFTELESELLQSDLTQETAQEAFLHYLEKLDQVAHLEVIAFHHQLEKDSAGNTAVDILHVFARTTSTPHSYYYRQRVDSSFWTAWERLELDIEGEHLIPVIWNRRLHLFWPIFTEKVSPLDVKFIGGNLSGMEPTKSWDIKLAWSELKQKAWTAKRVSTHSVTLNYDIVKGSSDFFFRTLIDDQNNLYVLVLTQSIYSFLMEEGGKPWAFRFGGCHTEPVVEGAWGDVVQVVTETTFDRMFYREKPGGKPGLYLPAPKDTQALTKTQGLFRLLPSSDGAPISEHPFFYLDDKHTFFIIPSKVMGRAHQWTGELMDPNLVLTLPEHYWEEVLVIPDPIGPIANPEDLWIFEPSFPVKPPLSTTTVHMAGNVVVEAGPALMGGAPVMGGAGGNIAPAAMPMLARRGDGVGMPVARNVSIPALMEKSTKGSVWSSSALAPSVVSTELETSSQWYHYNTKNRFLFQTFYHPYVCSFVRELNRNGVDGLLQRRVQTHPQDFSLRAPGQQPLKALDFKSKYEPHKVKHPVVLEPYPAEDVDFKDDAAYALYNWELFFHVPLLIADRLYKNQRYEEAQKWFHYIFDPTDTSSTAAPQRYWRTKPFHERTRMGYQREHIQYLLKLLAEGADPQKKDLLSEEEQEDLKRFENSVATWRKDPFKPHLIARLRTTAYQKAVVMKYLDNLLAWADQLFRRDTLESLNEATQLYVLAAELLGRRPEDVPPRATPRVQTYNSLEPDLDAFSNALVQIEEFVSPSADGVAAGSAQQPLPTLPAMLYFCAPRNDKLLTYWDTVSDRLFKLRHCMNIEGVVRQLPLFEPPIDPGLLVKAAAAGVDFSSVLDDFGAALPHFRFNVLAQQASELCSELKSLGQAMLSALEKRDAESLSLLRSQHETDLLVQAEQLRKLQLDEAKQNKLALSRARETAVSRFLHYQKLLGVQSPQVPNVGTPIPEASPSQHIAIQDEGGIKTLQFEKEEMARLKVSAISQDLAGMMEVHASIAHAIPNFNAEPWGVGPTFGGSNVGSALSAFASGARAIAARASYEASKSGRLGQYALRSHEWLLQSNQASREIMQIDQQLLAAELRVQIAEGDLSNHRRQLVHAREVEDFLKDKYTNQELYGWMIGQLATVYFQSYRLAFDLAKRAERAFRHELGLKDSSFIQFGYWDSLKKGLLAGERLYHDLKRMEVAYLDQNRREYELTRHASLVQIDPLALVQLRQTGACIVRLPEALFDLDSPGHFMRRIKSVSVSIPCVTGPHTGVHCTLTLLKSSVRHGNTLLSDKYYARQEGDPRFTDSLGAIQSVVTSSAQADTGLFEPNLRDERLLPFEGAGAISEWKLELPAAFRQFDYDTISDVILHVRYTAREGGELLRQQATLELQTSLDEFIRSEGQSGLAQLFSLRHEFPTEWHRFLNPSAEATGDQTLTLDLSKKRFPFQFQAKPLTLRKIELFVKIKPEFTGGYNESTLKLSLGPAGNSLDTITDIQAWNGLVRAKKEKEDATSVGPLGDWTLTAWLDTGNGEHGDLDPHAIQDILVVCSYTCS